MGSELFVSRGESNFFSDIFFQSSRKAMILEERSTYCWKITSSYQGRSQTCHRRGHIGGVLEECPPSPPPENVKISKFWNTFFSIFVFRHLISISFHTNRKGSDLCIVKFCKIKTENSLLTSSVQFRILKIFSTALLNHSFTINRKQISALSISTLFSHLDKS